MKQVLIVSDKLIFEIKSGKNPPESRENIVWVHFPKSHESSKSSRSLRPTRSSRSFKKDYENYKSLWVGLLADELVGYSEYHQRKGQLIKIKFKPNTVFLNSHQHLIGSIEIDLSNQKNYEISPKQHYFGLFLPSDAIIYPKCFNPKIYQTAVHRTVCVDPEFGNDRTGRIEQLFCPFQTIEKAIESIPKDRLTPDSTWKIQLAPGHFPDPVILPDYLYCVGSGPTLTSLSQVTITGNGFSGVSECTISVSNSDLRAITVSYSEEAEHHQITFENCEIRLVSTGTICLNEHTLINLEQTAGFNGRILFRNCQIQVDFYNTVFEQAQINIIKTVGNDHPFAVEFRQCTTRIISPILIREVFSSPSSLKLVSSLNTSWFDLLGIWSITSEIISPLFNQIFFDINHSQFIQNQASISSTHSSTVGIWRGKEARVISSGPVISFPDISQVNISEVIGNSELTTIQILSSNIPNLG